MAVPDVLGRRSDSVSKRPIRFGEAALLCAALPPTIQRIADRDAGAPRIRQDDEISTDGTTRPMRADHSCQCARRPEHHPPSRSNRARRRVRDKPATQHRRSPGSRGTGASSGGRNPAEQHPIRFTPWVRHRSIQGKMLVSESRRPRRNSVRYLNIANWVDSLCRRWT